MRNSLFAAAFAAMVGLSGSANAAPIVFTNYGQSDGLAANLAQPTPTSNPFGIAAIETGQPGGCGLSNCGWSPFGTADNAHSWWDIGNAGSVTFSIASLASSIKDGVLYVVWGSPNGDNTITLGNDSLTTAGLGPTFNSQNNPSGYLLGLKLNSATDITFSTNETAFEFAFTSPVPEPSTWAMMILGFAGLGFMAYRRRNQASALTAA
ncbi:PEP-CTERM sorting domain-containing protein [Bradyrhizobium japonicum]|nr:PEPxxWA-CTERM sorting domain-containing protein [Bradyrhizobium japonicum]MBR0995475.1 PEP-CTERM sorting domain-containing protein [Bradyrhizobium japonicum]